MSTFYPVLTIHQELKELIALHSSLGEHGGDLRTDTVTIMRHTLDMQEKTAKDVCRLSCRNENELTIFQAMTKIEDVFKISINDVLDYNMLRKICLTGHSRVPVYEEVELPNANGKKVQRILGVLLV